MFRRGKESAEVKEMQKSKREARCEEVIIYEELIGDGTEESPFRTLIVVRAKDGSFIAERETCDTLRKKI